MEPCQHCQHQLTEGFDFCHNCGASVERAVAPQDDSMRHVVEVVDHLKGLQSQAVEVGSSVSRTMDQFLGNPISTQRQIVYSLMTALALVLSWGSNPFTSKSFDWLQSWLLWSLFFLPLIHYQITGLIPFAKIGNALLGDLHTFRRRLNLTILWTLFFGLPFSLGLTALSSTMQEFNAAFQQSAANSQAASGISDAILSSLGVLATIFGTFLINFYLMGFASFWRTTDGMGGHRLGSRLNKEVERTASTIRAHLEERAIPGLTLNEIDMGSLRRHTAGESSGRRGKQLIITHGRARVILFVRDYGSDLFVRWTCHHDASGRRLWVLIGMALNAFNDLIQRWTGSSPIELWQSVGNLLTPMSANRDSVILEPGGGLFSQLFGLTNELSEYSWNDIYALERAVQESVEQVFEDVQAAHHEIEDVKFHNRLHGKMEAAAEGTSATPSTGGPLPLPGGPR